MQKIGRSIPVRGDDKSKASGAKNNRVCLGEPPAVHSWRTKQDKGI